MPKRASFYGVAMFSVAVFMTAGCATHDVVKKDESIVPASTVKPVDQSKPSVTPAKQAVTNATPQATTANVSTAQPVRKDSSTAQLQAALEKIYFEYDSAGLTDSARKSLTRNAALLMKEPEAKVRIEGNCDERGSAEYNVALGEQRARAALQSLQPTMSSRSPVYVGAASASRAFVV